FFPCSEAFSGVPMEACITLYSKRLFSIKTRLDLWKHVIVSSVRKQMSYHCCCGSLVLSFLFMALLRLYG
ncbi:unnamed protein product, partial [Arabidopsis halleri]